MMEPIEAHDYHGLSVQIHADPDPESPRNWDNLGRMVCWHSRYDLGDEHSYDNPAEFLLDLIPEPRRGQLERGNASMDVLMQHAQKHAVILPLYLYDHSGITMRTHPFSCPWDSGQVGYIYAPREAVMKEYGGKRLTKAVRQRVEKTLENEVSTYDDYLTGCVYGYTVETEQGDTLDSCWGFYGLDYCREEAMDAAKCHADRLSAQLELEALEHD